MSSALRVLLCIAIGASSACARWQQKVLCDSPPDTSVVQALRDSGLYLRWPTAHRGDRNSGPDNSKESITAAARYGVPLLETDIHFSLEGTPFLFHDRMLSEDNLLGPPELFGKSVTELHDADIAAARLPQTGSPMLFWRDALETVRPFKSVFQLDMKSDKPEELETVLNIARNLGLADRLIVQCQTIDELASMREKNPDIAVLARVRSPEEIDRAIGYHPEMVFAEEELILPAIQKIHNAGAKASVKVLGPNTDYPERWERLFRSGVDIIMTDHGNKMMWYIRHEYCVTPEY